MKPEIVELDANDLTRLRRGSMARFCHSLTPGDWLQLEALPERLRNGLLVLAVRELLKRRTTQRRSSDGEDFAKSQNMAVRPAVTP